MWTVVGSRVWDDEADGVWKRGEGPDGKPVDVIPQHEAVHSKEGEEEVIGTGEQDVLHYVYCRFSTLKLNTSR